MQSQLDMFIDFCEEQGDKPYDYFSPASCPLAQFGKSLYGDQPHVAYIYGGNNDYLVSYMNGSQEYIKVLQTFDQEYALSNSGNYADLTHALKELRHDV